MHSDPQTTNIYVPEVWGEKDVRPASAADGTSHVHGEKDQRAKLRCVMGIGFGYEVDPGSD